MARLKHISLALLFSSLAVAEPYIPKERLRGFNLTGMMVRNASPGSYEERDFSLIGELGFNFVRLPLDYRYWIVEDDGNKINPDALKPLDQALEWAEKNRLHVMIALHRAPGYTALDPEAKPDLFADPEAQKVCLKHWQFLAERYKTRSPEHLSFNLINEPSDKLAASNYVKVVTMLVNAVRPANPKRMLITDGLEWGRKVVPELHKLNIGQGTRGYEPHGLSHYKAEWAGNPLSRPSWPPSGAVTPLLGPHKGELCVPMVFEAIPACRFIIKPGMVSGNVDLQLTVNDNYLKLFPLHVGEGIGWSDVTEYLDWGLSQGRYNLTLECDLREKKNRVVIALTEGDWAAIDQIYLQTEDFQQAVLFLENSWGKTNTVITFKGFDQTQPFQAGNVESGLQYLRRNLTGPWEAEVKDGRFVVVGEFGAYKHTPHNVTLAWMEDYLKIWKMAGMGWALRDFRGPYGIIDSDREDVEYEDFKGFRLDRKMLELLKKY